MICYTDCPASSIHNLNASTYTIISLHSINNSVNMKSQVILLFYRSEIAEIQ